jgi:cysteine desulfurase
MNAMQPWMVSFYGNAHSRDHVFGDQAAQAIESAREEVAEIVGASAEDVIFTSGATESANIAIEGFCLRLQKSDKVARIALPPTEHIMVLETCREMARRGLAQINWISVDTMGRIDLTHLESLCRNDIDLVCVMGANNEIGNIYPVNEIGAITAKHGADFFCDGSQSIGKTPFDFEESQVDFLAVSAHKIYGPKGVGALVIREKNSVVPTRFGGDQERGLRPGTLNVPGIVGFGMACRLRQAEMKKDEEIIRARRDRLQAMLTQRLPDIRVNGDPIKRLAGNLHITVRGVPNDAIIARIRNRLAISTGAACSSGSVSPSHVLRAIGMKDDWIHGALRIGIGKFNTDQEIDEAAEILCTAIERVRMMGVL